MKTYQYTINWKFSEERMTPTFLQTLQTNDDDDDDDNNNNNNTI
jgi:hypothetical protein